jgi:hypothetical protein
MKEESIYFKKVFIHGEADLPKESGVYHVQTKSVNHEYTELSWFDRENTITRDYQKAKWIDEIDWYLQPLDEKEYLRELLIKYDKWNYKVSGEGGFPTEIVERNINEYLDQL